MRSSEISLSAAVFSLSARTIINYKLRYSRMEPITINVKDFAAKYRSKREVYTFLTIDGNAYLPPFDTITIYFCKSLVQGTKKCKYTVTANLTVINAEHVRHLQVPQYEELSVAKLITFLD